MNTKKGRKNIVGGWWLAGGVRERRLWRNTARCIILIGQSHVLVEFKTSFSSMEKYINGWKEVKWMITILPFTSNKQISLLSRWASSNHVGYFTPPFKLFYLVCASSLSIFSIMLANSNLSKHEFILSKFY